MCGWMDVVWRLRVGECIGRCSAKTEGRGVCGWMDVVWRLRVGECIGRCSAKTEGG